jgi:hypothetical protein
MDCIAPASFVHPSHTRADWEWIALRLRVLYIPPPPALTGNGLHCACEFHTHKIAVELSTLL